MDIDVTKSFRRTHIVNCYIRTDSLFAELKATTDRTYVMRIIKDEFFEEKTEYFIFETYKEANSWVSRQQVGAIVKKGPLGNHSSGNKFDDNLFVQGNTVDFDFAYPKCDEIFTKAGIRKSPFGDDSIVRDNLSAREIDLYVDKFGAENWTVAAELAYCSEMFPSDSLVFRAAEVMFHYFITKDDAMFGYLFRDLLVLESQLEKTASRIKDKEIKAGKGGGDKSARAKTKRLDSFMDELEALGNLYPTMNRKAIEDQAFDNAIKKNRDLWSQGIGQKENYLSTYIRSEEPYKTRYSTIFIKTA